MTIHSSGYQTGAIRECGNAMPWRSLSDVLPWNRCQCLQELQAEPSLGFLSLHEHAENEAEPQHVPAAGSACAAGSEQTHEGTAEAALLPFDELVASAAACWGSYHAAATTVWLESAC